MKKPKKAWKPVPVAVQVKRHAKAVAAAAKAAKHPSKAGTAKRSAAAKKAAATRAKHRKWSPDGDLACCSARALGTLLGWDWDDVLALYWRTANDPDAGATILDTLVASGECDFAAGLAPALGHTNGGQSLILGVALPEPHAVAVTPDGTWWSWGEPFDPLEWPELVIEETWAVTWA